MHRGCFILYAALFAVGPLAAGARAAEITFNQLRALAVESLRAGDVAYTPPSNKIVGRMLWVKDAGPFADRPDGGSLDYWLADGDLLKAVFLDQLAIEIRRQHLFARSRSQQVMDPYYRRMEAVVAAELTLAQQPGDDEEKQRQLDERLRQLGDLLQNGIDACARGMGLVGAFVEPGHDDGTLWLDHVFALDLPQQGQIGYGQIEQAVAQALRGQGLVFEAPKVSVSGGTLHVTDVELKVETMRALAPLEELVAELVKINLRRRQRFERPADRPMMDQIYLRMEAALRQQLDTLRRSGAATVAARRASLAEAAGKASEQEPPVQPVRSPLGRQLDAVLQQGINECAKRMGNLRIEYHRGQNAEPASDRPRVRLVAPPDTTIEFVYNTDHKLWSLAGRSEDAYPWKSHTAGDRVSLSGGYWFRLTYPSGVRASSYKKVAANDTELRFPSR
ncbi:MAG TPA: hypothetical protein VNH11_11445 [Pirellulales bacterium]|nr:hypothetical protein [Pirellulales bacterium]